MKEITIIIADDHPIVRQGLRQVIEADAGLVIVAESSDGRAALDAIAVNRPQIAVLDIDMPELDGFAVARRVREECPQTEIIFLTIHNDDELNIGVDKPTKEELLNISHHLIRHVSIHQDYNAGLYEWDALNVINSIFQRNQTAVLVGGTGLYIKAVIQGLDEFPQVSTEIKKQLSELYTLYGLEFIQQRLIEVDPEYAAEVDLHNPMRILRALEVSLSSGEKYSSLRARNSKNRNFKVIPVFISKDRTELYKIIDERVDFMVEKGLKQARHTHRFPSAKPEMKPARTNRNSCRP